MKYNLPPHPQHLLGLTCHSYTNRRRKSLLRGHWFYITGALLIITAIAASRS